MSWIVRIINGEGLRPGGRGSISPRVNYNFEKNNTVWHSNVRSYHFIWQIYSSQSDPTWITIAYHLDVNIDSSETISYLKCLIIFNPNRAAHLSVGAVGLSTNHVSKFTIQDVEILFRDFSRGRGFDCIFDFGVQLCRDWVQLFRVFWFSDATGTGRIGINGHNGVFGIHGTNLLKCSSTDTDSSRVRQTIKMILVTWLSDVLIISSLQFFILFRPNKQYYLNYYLPPNSPCFAENPKW